MLGACVVAFVVPETRRRELLEFTPAAGQKDGDQANLFTYLPEDQLQLVQGSEPTRWLAELNPSARWRGLLLEVPLSTQPTANLRVRWRGTGDLNWMQLELRGGPIDGEGIRTYMTQVGGPSREWSTLEVPIQDFKWSPYSNPGEERSAPLDTTRIARVAFTIPPGGPARIELAEVSILMSSGKWPWVQWSAVFGLVMLALRQLLLMLVGNRLMRRWLHESTARYQTIFNGVSEGIILADAVTARVLEVNPAACRLFGIERDEWSASEAARRLVQEAAARIDDSLEWTAVCGGEERRLVVRCSTAQLSDGRRLLISAHDVSAMRRVQQESERMQERLRESNKMEAVGRLARGVAHDFNNLLTGMLCAAELSLEEKHVPETVRDNQRKIIDFSRRAAELVRQLLTFASERPQSRQATDFQAMLRDMEGLIARVAGENNRLTVECNARQARVLTDRTQLKQVLLNLAANARDAMPDGGEVRFVTDNVEVYPNSPTGLRPGTYLRLLVSDPGAGMDEATRSRVFEPYFTTKPGKGSGLGLSVVYGIVHQHEGTVLVDSRPGRGSTFTVLLPLTDAPLETQRAVETADPVGGDELIFVVEDNDGVRHLVIETLRGAGYEVIYAESPEEAEPLFRMHASRVALLLSDFVMPGESGTQFYRRMLALRPDLRVLFMSGYSENRDFEFIENNGLPMLNKPFMPRELVRRVREVLDSRVGAA